MESSWLMGVPNAEVGIQILELGFIEFFGVIRTTGRTFGPIIDGLLFPIGNPYWSGGCTLSPVQPVFARF